MENGLRHILQFKCENIFPLRKWGADASLLVIGACWWAEMKTFSQEWVDNNLFALVTKQKKMWSPIMLPGTPVTKCIPHSLKLGLFKILMRTPSKHFYKLNINWAHFWSWSSLYIAKTLKSSILPFDNVWAGESISSDIIEHSTVN